MQRYLEQYVEHFNLSSKLRLGSDVGFVTFDQASGKWEVRFAAGHSQYFDKVVIATGNCQEPYIPTLESAGMFEGQILHSKSFKRLIPKGVVKTRSN